MHQRCQPGDRLPDCDTEPHTDSDSITDAEPYPVSDPVTYTYANSHTEPDTDAITWYVAGAGEHRDGRDPDTNGLPNCRLRATGDAGTGAPERLPGPLRY